MSVHVKRRSFGTLPDGAEVEAFVLRNSGGVEVRLITYGAILTAILTPDSRGCAGHIVLGHDTLEPYLVRPTPYFGAVVGRCANRVARGRFTLDGRTYQLSINEPPHHLHGGYRGFDAHLWQADASSVADGSAVELTLHSPDGDEGYPGTLTARVRYTLTHDDALVIDYAATTDAPTLVNLTQHSYFNLALEQGADVDSHILSLSANQFTPVDSTLIPTGELAPVDDTPFDFRTPTRIGSRIAARDPQLIAAGGYDHNWALDSAGSRLAHAASLAHPASGRTLDVRTTEPGLQFYSGNFLDGSITGRNGTLFRHRLALCLETQHYPDSPNHSNFPTVVLRPDEEFRSTTIWRFGVRDRR